MRGCGNSDSENPQLSKAQDIALDASPTAINSACFKSAVLFRSTCFCFFPHCSKKYSEIVVNSKSGSYL